MTKQLTKTIIGLDGVVQQPVTFTKISHTLGVFDGFTHNNNIGVGLTQFILSGIGSITTSDILKVNDEFMIVTEVGFSSTPTGTINDATDVAAGIATLPSVKVRRGQLGIAATTHTGGVELDYIEDQLILLIAPYILQILQKEIQDQEEMIQTYLL